MPQNAKFYVDGYLLRILDSVYLVEVEPANGRTGRYEKPANLPQWIFRSPHAIWLTQEKVPIMERAVRGEEVKQQIMNKEKNHEKKK